jgi:serine/threonine protein kinase
MELRDRLQSTLVSAYSVERELGGGGMSRVLLAREISLGRNVVVKVLSGDLAAGLSAERFAREVRLAAALQHPNIVPVLTTGVADGIPYYTMPYVRGESLRARLKQTPVLPTREAVSLLRDVAAHSSTRMAKASSTATSNPKMFFSPATLRSSPISESQRRYP